MASRPLFRLPFLRRPAPASGAAPGAAARPDSAHSTQDSLGSGLSQHSELGHTLFGTLSSFGPAGTAVRGRWRALAPRERVMVATGLVVLALYLLWAVALAPALRTLREAPTELDRLDSQLQRMRQQAGEARTLRATAPVAQAQAQQALNAATERLGPQAKLSLQGERAVLTVKGSSGAQLMAWLAEARAGARAKVVEATLTQSGPGLYDGTLTLALGGRG